MHGELRRIRQHQHARPVAGRQLTRPHGQCPIADLSQNQHPSLFLAVVSRHRPGLFEAATSQADRRGPLVETFALARCPGDRISSQTWAPGDHYCSSAGPGKLGSGNSHSIPNSFFPQLRRLVKSIEHLSPLVSCLMKRDSKPSRASQLLPAHPAPAPLQATSPWAPYPCRHRTI